MLERLVPLVYSCHELFQRMVLELNSIRADEFAMLGWRIWRERNAMCWEGKPRRWLEQFFRLGGPYKNGMLPEYWLLLDGVRPAHERSSIGLEWGL